MSEKWSRVSEARALPNRSMPLRCQVGPCAGRPHYWLIGYDRIAARFPHVLQEHRPPVGAWEFTMCRDCGLVRVCQRRDLPRLGRSKRKLRGCLRCGASVKPYHRVCAECKREKHRVQEAERRLVKRIASEIMGRTCAGCSEKTASLYHKWCPVCRVRETRRIQREWHRAHRKVKEQAA